MRRIEGLPACIRRFNGTDQGGLFPIPKASKDDAVLLEFKVQDTEDGEESLEDTVREALRQIEEKRYAQELLELGIERGRIRKYGFTFCGKTVLIGKG